MAWLGRPGLALLPCCGVRRLRQQQAHTTKARTITAAAPPTAQAMMAHSGNVDLPMDESTCSVEG